MIIQRSRTPPRRGRGRRVARPNDAPTSLLFPSSRRAIHHRGCAPTPLAAVSLSTAPTPHTSRASSSAANRSSNRDAGRRIGTPVARDSSSPRVKSRSTRLAVRLVGFPAAPARAPGALGARTAPVRHARASMCRLVSTCRSVSTRRFVSTCSTGRDDVRGAVRADGGASETTRRRATSSRLPGELCARELRAALKGDLGARFGSGRDGASTSISDAARAALRLTPRTVSGETSSSRRSSRETSGESSSRGEGAGRDARRLRGEGRAGRRGVSSSRSSSESSSRGAERLGVLVDGREGALRGEPRAVLRARRASVVARDALVDDFAVAGRRGGTRGRGGVPLRVRVRGGGGREARRDGIGVDVGATEHARLRVERAARRRGGQRRHRGRAEERAGGVAFAVARERGGEHDARRVARANGRKDRRTRRPTSASRRCADRATRDARRRGETMTRAVRYGGRRTRSCGVGTRSRGRVCVEGDPPRGGRRREARASRLHLTVQRPLRDRRARSSAS